ncbi:MAG TPA: TonB-dependent receptor [Candidatus Angelobacter sp.]|nr:TonB-dependent receptor [Candidatus Angelobacter sp.]
MIRRSKKNIPWFAFVAFLLIGSRPLHAQRARGELRIEVRDSQGAALAPNAEFVSSANQFRRSFQVSPDGRYIVQDLPFGIYHLTLTAKGFADWTDLVEVSSEVPVRLSVTMGVAPVTTRVEVNDSATLIDPSASGTQYTVGRQTLSESVAVQPGRDLSDLVNDLPGWLYESNSVLHPRGSEYDVQYVVDGLPLTQNRSPAFAPSFEASEVESLRVLTADFPAEYGRKLGGVVEVTTQKDVPSGVHGQFEASGGSFSMAGGSAEVSYAQNKNRFTISGDGFHTGRYLDSPVLQNFTNFGNGAGLSVSFERDLSDRNRLRLSFSRREVRFLVPNYLPQQTAGQRQDVANSEAVGQIYYQHTISSELFLSFSGSVRDSSATLRSNALSTPIIVSQNRGYREGYARGDLAGHHHHNNWKAGVDGIFNPVHEQLRYTITDPTQFDPGTQQQFQFSARRWDIEPSVYVQDQMHFHNSNVSLGLRFDQYAFVSHENAWSPRLGFSQFVPSLDLLFHASYDRVFQTPAMENLLLASSPAVVSLNTIVLRLLVRAARANYYEVGITKAFGGVFRIDANFFRRDFRNYSDDDVLLDTGVSFPISFASARIAGEELRLEVPHWGRFSGYLSYANQSGIGQGPITGGLLLGSEALGGLTDTAKFAVTQDQRNTARARVRVQAAGRLWFAAGAQYGTGVPADTAGTDRAVLLAQYGAAILDRVDFARGRVRPNFSLDAAAGLDAYRKEQRSVSLQIVAANLTDRVNVLNFASLFSGTGVAAPRSIAARLKFIF